MNIDEFYKAEVIGRILQVPAELNERTGEEVRAVPGVTFQTCHELEGFPLLSLRKMPMSFIPEQIWFLSGSEEIAWLSRHTKIWDSFAENGVVSSAYGNRWRFWLGNGDNALSSTDQIEAVLAKLAVSPSSRHGVVMTWDPSYDLNFPQKNVPCPVMFTLMVMDGFLHMHVVVRSNDMVLGFPTDVAGFALLQCIFAQKLGKKPGVYTHSISNAHTYAMHDDVLFEMARRVPKLSRVEIDLPSRSYERACQLDDSLIPEIKLGIRGYQPHDAITGIKIAL